MDEKEIEGLIFDNVLCTSFGLHSVDVAAHAIFEQLKEEDEKRAEEAMRRLEKLLKESEAEECKRVVWEGEGQIVHPRVSGGAVVSVPGIGRLLIDDRPSESRIGPHGLLVQVTVRRKVKHDNG